MDDTLLVHWTLVTQDTPQPLLHCSRCGVEQPYRSSGKFRLNANSRRIDAWLIYRCTVCGGTWNRPLLEPQAVNRIAPALLESFCANDPVLARRVAFDIAGLRRHSTAVEAAPDAALWKAVLSQPREAPGRLEIRLAVPQPAALRLDRLLARELTLSRRRLHRLQSAGCLVLLPAGPRALRQAVRDGTRVLIDLSREADAAVLAAAAAQ